jgi:DNA repair exonuclease SbcCD nuclease subunit
MMSARRTLRVIHTADVHLGSDGYGSADDQRAHDARGRRAFTAIVDLALRDSVDLVLIAGDLFDHNRVPDELVAFVQSELERLRQPVVLLPGNHDALYAGAIHDRHDVAGAAPHVHVIRERDGQVIELPALDLAVWGRAMEEHEPAFHPLAHLPARGGRRWHIAMGHGFFYPERQAPDRSSPIFADQIRDSGWDYIALGHQHVRTDVSQGSVTAYYAGAPSAAGTGVPGGSVLLVELSDADGVRVTPRSIGEPAGLAAT